MAGVNFGSSSVPCGIAERGRNWLWKRLGTVRNHKTWRDLAFETVWYHVESQNMVGDNTGNSTVPY